MQTGDSEQVGQAGFRQLLALGWGQLSVADHQSTHQGSSLGLYCQIDTLADGPA